MKTLSLILWFIGGFFSITSLILIASILLFIHCVKKYDEMEKENEK
jgi:hypothetical protein